VKGLTLLDKDFRQAVKSANNAHEKPVISEENLKAILGNVGSILTLNSGLLEELEMRMMSWCVRGEGKERGEGRRGKGRREGGERMREGDGGGCGRRRRREEGKRKGGRALKGEGEGRTDGRRWRGKGRREGGRGKN
jgi:hypothetical protein